MTLAFILVFGSACIHVGWNYLVKASGDKFATFFTIRLVTALIAVPIVLLRPPPLEIVPHLVATGLLHTVYAITLTKAYELGEYSLVYPIARGLSPLLAALLALGFLSETLPPVGWALLVVAVLGLVVVGTTSSADVGSDRGAVIWSIATAAMIGGYTVVDAAAVRISGDALGYIGAGFLSDIAFMAPAFYIMRWRHSPGLHLPKSDTWRSLVSGPMQLLGYVLVLSALQIAPVGFVSSIRETGIILSALVGWRFLGESFGPRRLTAALLVALGIAGMTLLLGA